ncbi:hypothetical protein [Streptomyces bottropensis]
MDFRATMAGRVLRGVTALFFTEPCEAPHARFPYDAEAGAA